MASVEGPVRYLTDPYMPPQASTDVYALQKSASKHQGRTQAIGVAPSAQHSHCVPGALRRARTDWPSDSGPPYAAHIMRLGPLTHVSRSGCPAISKPPIFPALFAALGRPGSPSSDVLPPLLHMPRGHTIRRLPQEPDRVYFPALPPAPIIHRFERLFAVNHELPKPSRYI